jgi:integrase
MASIKKQQNGRYKVRYRTPEGRYRAQRFDLKGDADRFAVSIETDKARGVFVDPRDGTILRDYAESWSAGKVNVRARTRINVEGRLRKHILPAFGEKRVSSIRPSDVRAWVADLTAELAPSTVKATFLTFGQIMRTAELDGLISRSPCIGVELPAETSHEEMHFLTVEQVTALASAHPPRYEVAILMAAFTGLRAGELWALKLERLNLRKQTVHVVESLSEIRGKLVTGPTKTRGRRTVTLPTFLSEQLADHIPRYASEGSYIFTAPKGGPVSHHNYMRRHFYPAARSARMPEGLRFHDLRHTCAAILTEKGWSPKQLQSRLGHASIRTTIDRYTHLFENHDSELLQNLDAIVRSARVQLVSNTPSEILSHPVRAPEKGP